ncbi:MAG TPA: 4'-phosphopantetheinyl transferase superfamily protein [Candidatus Acidoferrales bacterium]|nr:4'-phosphopantetheinyl transferase superfamily protein [Candidatus Acidoferrales bacterium]
MRLKFTPEIANIGEEIHVWHASLIRADDITSHLESLLSSDEKARAHRFHFARDRNRYVVARGLLRELLGAYVQQAPGSLEFCYAQYGKPFLAGENAASGFSFNLSHSGDVVGYAIAKDRNLGIDVEQKRVDAAGDEIAQRYFSAREISDLRTLSTSDEVEGFFNCWTRKEAYLKATGMGLQVALDRFAVSLAPGQPAQFLSGVETKWQITAHCPAEGYAAAVVYDGASCAIRYFSAENWECQETKIG